MGLRYVATNGNNANDGLTPTTAWLTWQHGVDNVVMGDILEIGPGTYHENVILNVDGAAGFPITIRKLAGSTGDVLLDGTGSTYAFLIQGRLYWNFQDFTVMNDGGSPIDTFIYGLLLTSSTALANAQGCFELHFNRVAVTQVNRNARNDCLGVPIGLLSYGDETAGGTASRNCTWDFCSFYDCTTERRDHVIGTGFFAVEGNVKNIAWRDNLFNNAGVTAFISGIDTGGNVLPGSNPDRPRQMVFLRNTVTDIAGEGFYNQACHDLLVAENVFTRTSFGVGCNTEPQVSAHYDITRRYWARDNLFIDTVNVDMLAGAFDNGSIVFPYDDVSDVWYTNNTIWRAAPPPPGAASVFLLGGNQAVPGKFGILGNSWFLNNIVISPGNVLTSTLPAGSTMQLDNNLYGSDGATPFEWLSIPNLTFPYNASQDRHGHFQAYATPTFRGPLGDPAGYHLDPTSWAHAHGSGGHTPPWYTPGLFGAYDPLVERDVYGDLFTPASVDVGADQLMSKPQLANDFRTTLPADVSKFNDFRYVNVDPRVGPGLAGQIGDLVYYENTPIRILMQKTGNAATAWTSVTKRPSMLDMLTAADLQALWRVITATPGLATLVDHLWQPAFETNLAQVADQVGAAPFIRGINTGSSSLRESGLGGALVGARAMATLAGTDSTWSLGAAGSCDVAAGAFAIGGFMQPDLEGSGGYWLSKRGDTGNKPGYSLGLDAIGAVSLTLVDTAGNTVITPAATQNHARAPHPFIAGRSITNNIGSICTDMMRSTIASGALGSLTNAFVLGLDLRIFGAIVTSMTGWVGPLWFATGAAAEAILAVDTVLCDHYTGLMAN